MTPTERRARVESLLADALARMADGGALCVEVAVTDCAGVTRYAAWTDEAAVQAVERLAAMPCSGGIQ